MIETKEIKDMEVVDPEVVRPDLSQMSVEELKKALKQKEQAQKQAREREKKQYEANRDRDMIELVRAGSIISRALVKFKEKAHGVMDQQAEKLAEYGMMRGNSKGGFSLKSSDGKTKIRRRRDTLASWDERSEKALQLIKDFLQDTIKKRDLKIFEILYSFIARNKAGDLEYAKVMQLLAHEDKYDDPRWLEGLRLLKESYSNHLKGYNYDFEVLDETSGKYKRLELNFSNI